MYKPYPVGTAIKYIGFCVKCRGKTGKIIGVGELNCWVVLPQSTCGIFTTQGKALVPWSDVELLTKKNEQLLFSFMEEQNA